MTYRQPLSHTTPHNSTTDEEDAVRYLEGLIRADSSLTTFQKGFEHYGSFVKKPADQINLLLMITRWILLTQPANWKNVKERLDLCQKAGWTQTTFFLTEGKEVLAERRYAEIWRNLAYDGGPHMTTYASNFAQHTPSNLEDLGDVLSLFFTLLPPPLGVTSSIVDALHQFNFPLAHALRLSLKHQTLPRFSEQVMRDHLWIGLASKIDRYDAPFVDLFGTLLFQETRALTGHLSASFFEEFFQQFTTTLHAPTHEGGLRALTTKERERGGEVLRCAQRLHTKALLTQDMALSARCAPQRRL